MGEHAEHGRRPRSRREVRAQLSIDRYEAKNNYSNAFFILVDWSVIAGATVLADHFRPQVSPTGGITIYVAAVIIIGSRFRALGILTHQAAHRQLFSAQFLNTWVGRITTAWPLLISLSDYAEGHQDHHRALGAPSVDPKAAKYKRLGLIHAPANPRDFILRHGGKALVGGYSLENLQGALQAAGERAGRLIMWIFVVGLSFAIGEQEILFLYWAVPFFTSYQIIRHWMEATEHASLIEDDSEWLQTRSWTSNRLVQWLFAPHSDSFHILHHQFPGVPHYNYTRVHRLLMRDCWEYRSGHHCDGLLVPRRADAPSVLRDILSPDSLNDYKAPSTGLTAVPAVSPRLGT
jgi:fatty acid desaturase